MRVVRIYGDHIEGIGLRFRLWMWWHDISEKELCDKLWKQNEITITTWVETLLRIRP